MIIAADICRDGGSYVLVYADPAGGQHEVELRVRIGEDGHRIGYEAPTVKSYASGVKSALSWDEGDSLGRRLAPLVRGAIEWGGEPRARECLELLSLRGQLPQDA